jgi:hypothetical protein
MKKIMFICLVLSVFHHFGFSGVGNNNEPYHTILKKSSGWYCEEQKGKYNIEVKNARNVSYPANLCEIIEKNRKPNERVEVKLGTLVTLYILSVNEIQSGVKFESEVSYVVE